MKKRYVIIVAGGNGTRMESDLPKQFMLLGGKPILMQTISCFYNFDNNIDIIITLPNAEIERWQNLCSKYSFTTKHTVVNGGKTRFHSVKNALAEIKELSLVAIHDGVRPLVSKATIEHCFADAEHTGAAIPVIECFESLRQIVDGGNISAVRDLYRLVQTPQVFLSEILLKAYNQLYQPQFTDDASVVEHNGHTISLVNGNRENIKITTPQDLIIAEALLKNINLF